MYRPCQVPTLLQLCVQAVAKNLLSTDEPDLATRCEAEIGQQVWRAVFRLMHVWGVTKCDTSRQQQITRTFAPFWQPEHLKLDLTENSLTCDLLSKFKSFSTNLVHLELVCQWSSTQGLLTDLTWLQGTPQLQCLSIRTSTTGWLEAPAVITQGCGGFHNFAHVPELKALDLERFSFGQTAEFHLGMCLARLVHLQVVNVGMTDLGNVFLESLTYGRRLAAWATKSGQTLTAEQLQWAQTNISQLQLWKTPVTQAGISHLSCLPQLRFLDVRWTGIKQSALIPLQKQFGLSCLQGGMLTASNSLALAANQNLVPCCCGTKEGRQALDEWARSGIHDILRGR